MRAAERQARTAKLRPPPPPDGWQPVDPLDLCDDAQAHRTWHCLTGLGRDITRAELELQPWWPHHDHDAPARLVRYGLLDEAPGGWRVTDKGHAWAIRTAVGAVVGGFIDADDIPAWLADDVALVQRGAS